MIRHRYNKAEGTDNTHEADAFMSAAQRLATRSVHEMHGSRFFDCLNDCLPARGTLRPLSGAARCDSTVAKRSTDDW